MDTGEGLHQMADVKDALDVSVKQNFIDPLQNLQDKELKEIAVCFFEQTPRVNYKGPSMLFNPNTQQHFRALDLVTGFESRGKSRYITQRCKTLHLDSVKTNVVYST